MAGLRERKKLATRAAIHDGAMRLFAEQGFAGTTIDQIADAADVSARDGLHVLPGEGGHRLGRRAAGDRRARRGCSAERPRARSSPTVRAWLGARPTGWLEPRLLLQRRLAARGAGRRRPPRADPARGSRGSSPPRSSASGGRRSTLSARLAAAGGSPRRSCVAEEAAAAHMERDGSRARAPTRSTSFVDDAIAFAEGGYGGAGRPARASRARARGRCPYRCRPAAAPGPRRSRGRSGCTRRSRSGSPPRSGWPAAPRVRRTASGRTARREHHERVHLHRARLDPRLDDVVLDLLVDDRPDHPDDRVVGKSLKRVMMPTRIAPSVAPTSGTRSSRKMITAASPRTGRRGSSARCRRGRRRQRLEERPADVVADRVADPVEEAVEPLLGPAPWRCAIQRSQLRPEPIMNRLSTRIETPAKTESPARGRCRRGSRPRRRPAPAASRPASAAPP